MKIGEVRTPKITKSNRFFAVRKYFGVELEPWHHPDDVAKYILNMIKHTHMFGAQFIAPMGWGKSTAATVIAHHIHTIDNSFIIIWAKAIDFQHLKRFLQGLEKVPTIIIFDDMSSALKQMSDRDIEKNFEDLTNIRWIVDPETGSVPIIVFVVYHYSKNLEKEFRAVLGMSIFLGFGAEEYTNIDTIMPKKTLGRPVVEYFSKMSDKMFSTHKFVLLHSNGVPVEYKTDEPCRAMCVVMGKEARIILTAKDDQCAKCAKRKFKKYGDTKTLYEEVYKIYKIYGKKAWKLACMKRGYFTFSSHTNTALNFIENDIATNYDVDWKDMADEIKKDHIAKRNREYHKKSEESKAMELIESTSKKEVLEEDIEDEEQEVIENDKT